MTAPAPLTPADCDLQDFPFMPLQVARLRDSDLAATVDPEACWYAVLLWAAAWHQVPGASLPDDDAVLTRLVGLGRDVRTFKKHKEGALRGFVKCSDGRLYHPVVAEQANESWTKKLAYQDRKAQRTEIAKKAAEARWSKPEDDPSSASAPAEAMHDASETDASSIPDAMLKGTGTGTGTKEEESFALVAAATKSAAEPKSKPSYPEAFEAAWRAYPHVQGRSAKPKALAEWRKLTADDRDELAALIQRFKPRVDEVCGGRGAPCMSRWLKDGKHQAWRTDGAGEPVKPEIWVQALAMWRNGEGWSERLGPEPDQPGTRVPRELLITAALTGKAA